MDSNETGNESTHTQNEEQQQPIPMEIDSLESGILSQDF
jgi:hypothetical protein